MLVNNQHSKHLTDQLRCLLLAEYELDELRSLQPEGEKWALQQAQLSRTPAVQMLLKRAAAVFPRLVSRGRYEDGCGSS